MKTVPLSADRWAPARAALRTAEPRMADLIAADPTLDPDIVRDGWPTDLRDALVFHVVGQQLSVAATRAIVARLEALQDGRLPTPAELLATDSGALRWIGLSRAKAAYLPRSRGALLRRPARPGPTTESRRRSGPDRADGQGPRAIHRRRCPDVRPAPTGHLACRQPSSPACRRASLGPQRACVARRHRRDRRALPALANARRPLSLSIRSPRGGALSCGRSNGLRSFAYTAPRRRAARRVRTLARGLLRAARYRKG